MVNGWKGINAMPYLRNDAKKARDLLKQSDIKASVRPAIDKFRVTPKDTDDESQVISILENAGYSHSESFYGRLVFTRDSNKQI